MSEERRNDTRPIDESTVQLQQGPTLSLDLTVDESQPRAEFGVGSHLDHYEILRECGRGAMGVVYAAHDHKLEREVAIKCVRDRGDLDAHRRLVAEAKAMAQLSHPNVVSVFEVRECNDAVFIIMEYVEGVTLSEWLHRCPRNLDELLPVFRAAGEGLAAAHARGLVHRDFKPANVMFGEDGRARVMDFGLARNDPTLDSTLWYGPGGRGPRREIAGTPAYMAPEQFRGWADAQSDQYSFCASLYQAVYGTKPFVGSSFEEIRAAVEQGVQPPKDSMVPHALEQIILRGLSKQPNLRFPSMVDLLESLAECEVDLPFQPTSPPVGGAADGPEPSLSHVQRQLSTAADGPSRLRGGGAREAGRIRAYMSAAALVAVGVVVTLVAQSQMCPATVPVEACHIRIESDDPIKEAWIFLKRGAAHELIIDGKILHFDCVDETASVVVDFENGGLRYWPRVALEDADILELGDARTEIPPDLLRSLGRDHAATRPAPPATDQAPAIQEPKELVNVENPDEPAPKTDPQLPPRQPNTTPKPEPDAVPNPVPDAEPANDAPPTNAGPAEVLFVSKPYFYLELRIDKQKVHELAPNADVKLDTGTHHLEYRQDPADDWTSAGTIRIDGGKRYKVQMTSPPTLTEF